ncbi:hypothetical protein COCVIDRAFT_35697 [Bipolaris victoriae FI3]|uniref:Uncharacterized protein n=1 Tax=Bipolaris victoriae (strain FI3) TaxID=930091 RepID=W7EG55_BIPV3|nr:hypothetical protein COCVIDRAFT_35697 [Bipolaris victoriae FI3]
MARNDAPDMFMSLPLEVRHSIFEYLSNRASSFGKDNPKRLLLHWFEKEESEDVMAAYMRHNPNAREPLLCYSYNDVICASEYDGSDSDTTEEDETDTEEEEEDDEDEDEDEDEDDDEDEDGEDNGEDDEEVGYLNLTHTVAHDAYSSSYRPLVYPSGKWHHVPEFISLTHFPPPLELLLTSRQLNIEAKNWFYNVAVLRINATRKIAHTSFFELALGKIADAAFSPMRNIRKAEVKFVWDSVWIRTDTTGLAEAVFPALLQQRAIFVYKILYDSVQDNESANLKMEVLKHFQTLAATVQVEEHYLAPDAKPKKHSIAGKRRLEFESFLSDLMLGHPS